MILIIKILNIILLKLFFLIAKLNNNNFNKKEIRPFFGFQRSKLGGPAIRTKRLQNEFGNYFLNFNVIYAQSYWSYYELELLYNLKKNINVPIIFNQNGWYYKGWFGNNTKRHNDIIIKIQKISEIVIYQSEFCKISSNKINNYVHKNNIILHNCLPDLNFKINKNFNNKELNCFVVGYFRNQNNKKRLKIDIDHITFPAIEAFYNLVYKRNCTNIKLNFVGLNIKYFKNILDLNLRAKFIELYNNQKIILHDSYNSVYEYKIILKKMDFCLHLKYKDPCPNAIVERLKYGIPHIYSNSGGTPELVGKGGIGINVIDTWSTQISVDSKVLANEIINISNNLEFFSNEALKQSIKFDWLNYIKQHRNIFENAIKV